MLMWNGLPPAVHIRARGVGQTHLLNATTCMPSNLSHTSKDKIPQVTMQQGFQGTSVIPTELNATQLQEMPEHCNSMLSQQYATMCCHSLHCNTVLHAEAALLNVVSLLSSAMPFPSQSQPITKAPTNHMLREATSCICQRGDLIWCRPILSSRTGDRRRK